MGFGWRGAGAALLHWSGVFLISGMEILTLNFFHFKKRYPLDIITLSNPAS